MNPMNKAVLILLLAGLGQCVLAQSPSMQAQANLNQLMRGVIYPASNVVFSAQNENPADVKRPPGQDPAMATNPLASTFGGWQAVENAALALTESANLLLVTGRTCANGEPAPISHPDWAKFVQQLRDAGMKAYKAAQSKDQDKMIDAADTLTEACAGCHRKWREKPAASRCK
jgi:cytochrome c556